VTHLLLVVVFVVSTNQFKVVGRNYLSIPIHIQRYKKGLFKIRTPLSLGKCRIDPVDQNLTPAFKATQYQDRKTFITGMRYFGPVDVDMYIQCEVKS